MSEKPYFIQSSSHETATPLITMPSQDELDAIARVREANEASERARLGDWAKMEKHRKWKGRMKKTMAATALLASVKSGGLIDMATDPFHDAAGTATSAIEVSPVSIPDEMDGIAFEDYDQSVQDEHIAAEKNRVIHETEAKNTVVGLFERADAEGYQRIVAEVQSEHAANSELYASDAVIEQARTAIGEAESNSDALKAFESFVQEYDMTAGFGGDVQFDGNQGAVKKVLSAYIDVFSVLPKDFIKLAELERLTVSDEELSNVEGALGSEAGTYSSSHNTINIVTHGPVLGTAFKVEGVVGGDDYSYQSVVAHELGHALSHHIPIGSHLEEDETVDMSTETDAGAYFGQILKNHIGRADHMSVYGRTESEENTAEVLSGVLSDRTNGLASVEETRRFTSGANKSMIDMLAQLEAVRPGIAKILIANRLS